MPYGVEYGAKTDKHSTAAAISIRDGGEIDRKADLPNAVARRVSHKDVKF